MKVQRFKGRTIKQAKLVNNILKVYNNDSFAEDQNWYVRANEYAKNLASINGITVLQASGVIASLSPLKSWDENRRIAREFLNNGSAYHTSTFIGKAEDILNGDGTRDSILTTLNGNKTRSFFLNIAYPNDITGVTIDRHALSVAMGKTLPDSNLKGITKNQYSFFESAYVQAADKVGILPHEMQAVVWVKWRKLKEAKKFEDVPF